MKEYFEIGQIVNTNGLKGVVKIKPFTDDITKFEKIKDLYIVKNKELLSFKIEYVRYNKNMVLLKLKGIDSIEEAEKYRNCFVKIERDENEKLPENIYYVEDLLKCEVFTEEGILLGKMQDVFQTGSNDVYVVKDKEGKEILLPAIQDVIKNVDIKNKKITVKLLKGLI